MTRFLHSDDLEEAQICFSKNKMYLNIYSQVIPIFTNYMKGILPYSIFEVVIL